MENQDFSPLRRALVATLGGIAIAPALGFPARGQSQPQLSLKTVARKLKLSANLPESAIGSLETTGHSASVRFAQGQTLEVSLSSELPAVSLWNWVGFDGLSLAEPLLAQKPVASGSRASFILPLRQAGTFLIDARMLDSGRQQPSASLPLIVEESAATPADRDEVLLIEDWRVMPDGRALGPGIDPKDAATVYTANGRPSLDIRLRPNERLRLRVINGCQRAPIGLKIANLEVRVMAIDSQPAEPFVARDGQLVLATGSRTDVFIDATQPPGSVSDITLFDGTGPRKIGQLTTAGDAARPATLPAAAALSSAHLPAQLDLKNAARIDLALDVKAPWVAPAEFAASAQPAFQIRRGRVAVIAIANKAATPAVFRLHGHHFRLLDRLDDGWKPFWLDTLLLNAGQTQRIAFLAEYPGQWLMEVTGIDWASPRLVRSYTVG
jgi:FtsP/CotA-like multicopper oxidase with cupredoxin domain